MAELFAGSWETVSSRPAPLVPASLCSQTVTTVTSRPCQVSWLRQHPGAREKVFVLLLEVRCEERIIIYYFDVVCEEEGGAKLSGAGSGLCAGHSYGNFCRRSAAGVHEGGPHLLLF